MGPRSRDVSGTHSQVDGSATSMRPRRPTLLPPWAAARASTAAVASVAAVFALFHGDAGPRAIFLMLVGLVLGWARLQSRGLKAPIVIHGLQNAVAAALIVFRGG